MCDTRDDPERERRYVETLAARRVDGLIITGTSSDAGKIAGSGSAAGVITKSSMRRAGCAGSLTHFSKGAASNSYSISSGATQGMDSVVMRKPMGESPTESSMRSGRGNHN